MLPIWLFCLYMTFLYVPWDIFIKPVAQDAEVFFGYMFEGWWAKATALIHWLIYGLGAYGFWKMKRWMHPWASLYVVQIAISMVVWVVLYRDSENLLATMAFSAVWVLLAVALWRSRHRFDQA